MKSNFSQTNDYWVKYGVIVRQEKMVPWLVTSAGPCCAVLTDDNNIARLYVTGRDALGRSRIGLVNFDLERGRVLSISRDAVLTLGERGAFDENGTSYPYIVRGDAGDLMYYTGWVQGVQVPWYNDLGVALKSGHEEIFHRISRSPLPLRSDSDFIGIGSTCVVREQSKWLMWYTRFERWGAPGEHRHFYNIKHATSVDGVSWKQSEGACIDFSSNQEFAIAKPCVLNIEGTYFMWYTHRGSHYMPGLAVSDDGASWERIDDCVGISLSDSGWDSEMLCYPFVMQRGNDLFMFYNGNGYGASGLGYARTTIEKMLKRVHARN